MINSKWRINGTSFTCYVLIFYSIWKSRWKNPLSFYFYFYPTCNQTLHHECYSLTCVMGWSACAQSKSLISASGSRSALYRVTTFPDSHRALWVSLHHPPSPPPVPLRSNHCPPGINSIRRVCPLLSHQALWLDETVRNSSQTKTHTFIWRCGTINRRDEASRDQILSTETSTAQRSSYGTYNHCSNDQLSGPSDSDPQGKLKIHDDIIFSWDVVLFMLSLNSRISWLMTLFFFLQLRKPLVEKLRRERINSSIEQLKSLLGPEFLKQQPDSKLEKADILEMTVCFLTQLQQQNQQQGRLLNHFNKLQSSSDKNLREADFSPLSSTVQTQTSITKEKSPVNSALWRPW